MAQCRRGERMCEARSRPRARNSMVGIEKFHRAAGPRSTRRRGDRVRHASPQGRFVVFDLTRRAAPGASRPGLRPRPGGVLSSARRHPSAGHRHQGGDAVLGGGMGREQIVHARTRQGIDDEEMARSPDWLPPCGSRSDARHRQSCSRRRQARAAGRIFRHHRRSAEYSRVRLIAICTIIAASGARMIIAMVPIGPSVNCGRGHRTLSAK